VSEGLVGLQAARASRVRAKPVETRRMGSSFRNGNSRPRPVGRWNAGLAAELQAVPQVRRPPCPNRLRLAFRRRNAVTI